MSNWLELCEGVDDSILEHMGEPVEALYTPKSGTPKNVVVNFRNVYDQADVGHGGIAASRPMVGTRLAQLEPIEPDEGDLIFVRGATWSVTEVQPNGQGWVLLFLHKRATV